MNILDDATLIRQELERRLTPEHVDQHLTRGELAVAAGLYAGHSAGAVRLASLPTPVGGWMSRPANFPLHSDFWCLFSDPRKSIAYSVALLAMEADRLERLDRAAAAQRGAA